MLRIDAALIARLDASIARCEIDIVNARRRADPDSPARAMSFNGGAVIAQGRGRYVNRAIGVSLTYPGDEGLDDVESFFAASGLSSSIEVSSWAAPAVPLRLAARGYRLDWFGETFARNVDVSSVLPGGNGVEVAPVTDAASFASWERMFSVAFGYDSAKTIAISREHTGALADVDGLTHFIATVDGRPAGCASLTVDAGVAWLGGAATAPGFRRRGVQQALLAARLRAAADADASLAAATAVPTGDSARNLRAAGFTPAHTRAILTQPSDQRGRHAPAEG